MARRLVVASQAATARMMCAYGTSCPGDQHACATCACIRGVHVRVQVVCTRECGCECEHGCVDAGVHACTIIFR